MNPIETSINATKKEFEKSFEESEFYNKQTQDDQHLRLIMDNLNIAKEMKILDLGTGSGYLAFSIARDNPNVQITGLDIVEQTLINNKERAKKEGHSNLKFVSYDGVTFPFKDGEFDIVVTRYALHHFPVINETFEEISRVLKKGGKLFVSDPTPNQNDTERFVDAYMKMKKDGHIKFYTQDEFKDLATTSGLTLENSFITSIRFPKKKKDAPEFDSIMKKSSREIMDSYDIEIVDEEIYITEKVLNMAFVK